MNSSSEKRSIIKTHGRPKGQSLGPSGTSRSDSAGRAKQIWEN